MIRGFLLVVFLPLVVNLTAGCSSTPQQDDKSSVEMTAKDKETIKEKYLLEHNR